MTAVGIAWASLLTVPYAILSSAVSQKKMGVYMGMFNLFVVIPQILAAAALGLLVRTIFHGQAIFAIVLGGAAMVVAGIFMAFVKDPATVVGSGSADQVVEEEIREAQLV
jgi:maltose/moltooligosaccharide transporter